MGGLVLSCGGAAFPADPRLTDYDLLLENLRDLKEGKATKVCFYISSPFQALKTRGLFASFTEGLFCTL